MSAESTAVSVVSNAQRIVAKVGSSLVTNEGRGLDRAAVAHWAAQIAALRKQGRQVVLVSSGAIAEGMARLGWRKRPSVMHELQAAAARWACARRMRPPSRNTACAQILLTHETRRLPERPQHAVRAAAPGRGAHRQRERHRRHRRDPAGRQRYAGRAGHQPDRSRHAGHPDRPARPVRSDPRKNPDAKFISHAQAATPRWKPWLAAPAAASAPAAC